MSFKSPLKASRVDTSLATSLQQHSQSNLTILPLPDFSSKLLVKPLDPCQKGGDGCRSKDWRLEKLSGTSKLHTAPPPVFPLNRSKRDLSSVEEMGRTTITVSDVWGDFHFPKHVHAPFLGSCHEPHWPWEKSRVRAVQWTHERAQEVWPLADSHPPVCCLQDSEPYSALWVSISWAVWWRW